MTMNDTVSAAISKIANAEKAGKEEVFIRTSSNILKKTLDLLRDLKYVGEYIETRDSHGPRILLKLIGQINEIGPIKPRYAVKLEDYEKYEKRYLAAKDFGVLIVSTSKGLMTHKDAKKQGIGGKLIAYCY
ncbi:MAG: 30S ribosomal protein S8 [Candidatus Woesearchaeota archaeon]